jgi:hypothetical protein
MIYHIRWEEAGMGRGRARRDEGEVAEGGGKQKIGLLGPGAHLGAGDRGGPGSAFVYRRLEMRAL